MALIGEVPAYLTQGKYTALLQRHGQYVRWMVGHTCPCVKETGTPDARCNICQGRGKIFKFQEDIQYYNENSPHNAETVGVLNPPIKSVSEVRRCGYPYSIVSNTTTEITIAIQSPIPRLPYPYEVIEVDYVQTRRVRKTVTDVTVFVTEKIIQLNGIEFEATRNDQIQRKYPVDIVNIVSVEDTTTSTMLTPNEFHRNLVFIDETPDAGHTFEVIVDIINPFKFVVMGISDKMRYEDAYLGEDGDAQLLVPYNMYVGGGDMISMIAGERRSECILNYINGENTYELSEFDIHSVLKIIDANGNDDYVSGTDFLLTQNDKLTFLGGGSHPTGKFTVVFLFHPAFTIIDDIPMLRSHENKRFPRKVTLKRFQKVNEQFEFKMTGEL